MMNCTSIHRVAIANLGIVAVAAFALNCNEARATGTEPREPADSAIADCDDCTADSGSIADAGTGEPDSEGLDAGVELDDLSAPDATESNDLRESDDREEDLMDEVIERPIGHCVAEDFPVEYFVINDVSDIARIRETGCVIVPALSIRGYPGDDLAGLDFVEEIEGSFWIGPAPGLRSTRGMSRLRRIGGSFWTDSAEDLEELTFGTAAIDVEIFFVERASSLRYIRALADARMIQDGARVYFDGYSDLIQECDSNYVLDAWLSRGDWTPGEVRMPACFSCPCSE